MKKLVIIPAYNESASIKKTVEEIEKKANEFLKDGDKVKISIRFRGREIGHSKVGMQIMEDFAKATEEFGTVDKQPKMEGKSLVMFLAPKN